MGSMNVFASGAWRKAKGAYVFAGGAWRKAKAVWVFTGGAWRKMVFGLNLTVGYTTSGTGRITVGYFKWNNIVETGNLSPNTFETLGEITSISAEDYAPNSLNIRTIAAHGNITVDIDGFVVNVPPATAGLAQIVNAPGIFQHLFNRANTVIPVSITL